MSPLSELLAQRFYVRFLLAQDGVFGTTIRGGCANFSVLAHTPGGRCDGVWFGVLALALA